MQTWKRIPVVATATLLTWQALAAVQPSPPLAGPLTAEQIVARNVDARGGLEHWRAIHNMVWTGHMEGSSAEMPFMQFRLDQERPGRIRFEINSMGQRSARVFDGSNGWNVKPGHGGTPDVQPYTLQEIRFAQGELVIDSPLIDAAAHGSQVSLTGEEEVAGHTAYHLEVVRSSGAHESVWVNADSFLESRYERLSYDPAGKPVPVSVYYHDYREFGGVRIPTRIDIGGGEGAAANRMVIEQVELNATLDPRTFAEPGSPRTHTGGGMNSGAHKPGRGEMLPSWALQQAAKAGPASPQAAPPAGTASAAAAPASTAAVRAATPAPPTPE